ncbi:predicted protein [Histoplasma capsulatum G186AR]|uniref:Uncharacterized protein n=1 Tax=Ajellomyces capsulatus (strain G186AR / H82 / ATCC MYA-2454 / RMSCC 2432) TaxID=447093 RepID=C0NH02_AJECG|nr:uncharacterized protein HCBG_02624 [Histoplasma capsulatum G186AR]EEH09087.1 predicted protein [Histoplasma capsulatum G186AR]
MTVYTCEDDSNFPTTTIKISSLILHPVCCPLDTRVITRSVMRMLHRWLIWTYLVTLEENGWKSSSFDGCDCMSIKYRVLSELEIFHPEPALVSKHLENGMECLTVLLALRINIVFDNVLAALTLGDMLNPQSPDMLVNAVSLLLVALPCTHLPPLHVGGESLSEPQQVLSTAIINLTFSPSASTTKKKSSERRKISRKVPIIGIWLWIPPEGQTCCHLPFNALGIVPAVSQLINSSPLSSLPPIAVGILPRMRMAEPNRETFDMRAKRSTRRY